MTWFLKTLETIFTSAKGYPQLLTQPLGRTILFFILSHILIGLLFATRLIFQTIPETITSFQTVSSQLVATLPEDFFITWNGEQLSHQPDSVFNFNFPNKDIQLQMGLPEQMLSLTNQSLDNNLLNAQFTNSFIVVDDNEIWFQDSQNSWQSLPLSQVPHFENSFSFTKAQLQGAVQDQLSLSTSQRATLAGLAVIIAPALMLITTLGNAVFDGVFIVLLAKLNGMRATMSQLIQLILYVSVVASTLNQVALLFYEPTLPLFSLSFWAIILYVFFSNREYWLGKQAA